MSENMRTQSEMNTYYEVYRLKGELLQLREQNRVLRLEFQSLLNAIDDSYDEDLPVEIVEARNKAQAALTATSQEGQHEPVS